FPTLNLAAEQELLPRRGVYITRSCLDGEQRSRRSVTNIGMRPTFNATSLSVETHLLDAQLFSPPKRIEVRFWERLRDEKKFNGPEELRANRPRHRPRQQILFAPPPLPLHSPAGLNLPLELAQALRAVAANFGARNRYLHVEVPRDLVFQLFVEAAFEFADLAAPQAGHVNVVPRTVRLVIVAVSAQVQQIQLIDQAFFFQQVDGSVDGDDVHARVNFLRPLE